MQHVSSTGAQRGSVLKRLLTLPGKLFLLLLVFLASACDPGEDGQGDGGGIGGTGVMPPLVQSTGVSVGPITGFGSILLNAQQFNTDGAEFLVNGELASQTDLRIGMAVIADVDFSDLTASRINYLSTVIGPLNSMDAAGKAFVLLNQPVIVNAGTTFEGTSLEQLGEGKILEVSGIRDENGTIVATYVRPALQSERYQLVGVVLGQIDSEQRLNISGLNVDLSQVDLSQASQLELSFGSHVLIEAPDTGYDSSQPLLRADILRGSVDPAFANGDTVEYEGIVSTFDSLAEFTLNWQASSASSATLIENQDGSAAAASNIAVGSRIEVEGSIDEQGVLVARKIIVIAIDDGELQGAVEQLDSAASTLTVLGIRVQVDNRTRYPDIGSFESLRVGDYVDIDAASIGTRFLAGRVRVEQPDSRGVLKAPVTSLNVQTGEFRIAGLPIVVNSVTEFENRDDREIEREDFFRLLKVGDVVKVQWDEYVSTTAPPDEVGLE